MIDVFWVLLAAHCYGDFLLQNRWMALGKSLPSWNLRLLPWGVHCGIHGLLAYVLLQDWSLWYAPLLIFIFHGAIDWFKPRRFAPAATFAIDQAFHVASVFVVMALLDVLSPEGVGFTGLGFDWIVGGAGFCAVVFGSGFFIAAVAASIIDDNQPLREQLGRSLPNGGKMIGQLERALIFVLFLVNQPAGVGVLIAAKSILRFEEAKRQQMAEYVLIGTLWSFGLAILLSWGTFKVMQTNLLR